MPKNEAPKPATIESILHKRKKKETYDVIPTNIDGVSLRVEAGKKPRVHHRALGKLALAGSEFAARKAQLTELARLQETPEKEIKSLAQDIEGLRGIQSARDNYKLNVMPKDTITWKPDALKEALGIAYHAVVTEELAVAISIPNGYATDEGPLTSELLQQALINGLAGLGLPREQLGMLIDPKVVATVNESKLAELLASGQVSSLENTGDVSETWAITVDPLYKPSIG